MSSDPRAKTQLQPGEDKRETLTPLLGDGTPTPTAPQPTEQLEMPDRFEDLGILGMGGMGEVRRVRDTRLGRIQAMKILRTEFNGQTGIEDRFVEEAQATAQLEHPGLVPVHECGRLPDGRWYFTMKEVRGLTLAEVIATAHHRDELKGEWTLGRMVDAFRRVCEAVGHAHARGVVHRDLKPENIMVGAHGEVLVLDWGLAKVLSAMDDEPQVKTVRTQEGARRTRMGTVAGTPAYMSPEQALGLTHLLNQRTDVYALGAILYEILSGRPAFPGDDTVSVLQAVREHGPQPLRGTHIPDELQIICVRSMARVPDERFPDATALAEQVREWQEGARKRERALQLVAHARTTAPQLDRLRQEARAARTRARVKAEQLATWSPTDAKKQVWALEDEAAHLEEEAALAELNTVQLLQGALTHAPDLPDAHDLLADLYRARHAEAEATRNRTEARRYEALLRAHDGGRHARYLRGEGALALRTQPPGAQVTLRKLEMRDRRLHPTTETDLGTSPVYARSLEMGSYLAELQLPGHTTVQLPITLARGELADGVRPGDQSAHPITLPVPGAIGEDEVYVPAGWTTLGGDPEALNPWSRRRAWIDAFAIQRFPVTNADYILFLDDLVASGRAEQALRCVPRERNRGPDTRGAPIYGRDDQGRFVLVPDADGDVWDPRWPVILIDWSAARTYARWFADRTGQGWRLPMEAEWEKAARGTDGRFLPWGDHMEPTWAAVWGSRRGRPLPATVDAYPEDISPYGVRGMAGGVSDWCADRFTAVGRFLPDRRVPAPADDDEDLSSLRVVRGGSWSFTPRFARSANRREVDPKVVSENIGFRLARSLTDW